MGAFLLSLSLWIASAGAAPAPGLVLLSRHGWQEQEARLIESLRIYTRDLNLRIETDLLPHEAKTADEQTRSAEGRCGSDVAMVLWFTRNGEGPLLSALRCQPHDLKLLPLSTGANTGRDLDLAIHGLALKLRATLALLPEVARPPKESPAEPRGANAPPATELATPAGPSSPPAAAPPAEAPPARRSPPEVPPRSQDAPARDEEGPPAGLALRRDEPAPRSGDTKGLLVGARWLGWLADGQSANGQALGAVFGRASSSMLAELAVSAGWLQDQTTGNGAGLSWRVLAGELGVARRLTAGQVSLEPGLLAGVARYTVSGTGTGARGGTSAGWSAELGGRVLLRWRVARHLALETFVAVLTGLPRHTFNLDGAAAADTGTVRGVAGGGLAYLF